MEDQLIDIWEEETCQTCMYMGYDIDSRQCVNCRMNYGFSTVSNYTPKISYRREIV